VLFGSFCPVDTVVLFTVFTALYLINKIFIHSFIHSIGQIFMFCTRCGLSSIYVNKMMMMSMMINCQNLSERRQERFVVISSW